VIWVLVVMKVSLQANFNDSNVDANQLNNQRQLEVSISVNIGQTDKNVPLNLCLVLDHSASMNGKPLEMVKRAAIGLVDRLKEGDRLSIVAFDHRAKVLIPNQILENPEWTKQQIAYLSADGGTAIDEGLRLGIEQLAKGKQENISQVFLLTDGENEHGDNNRCLKLAQLAANHNLTLNALGFGDHWNQDILERIADTSGGTLSYIQRPDEAIEAFNRLFKRAQSIGLTNAHLLFQLMPNVRLAKLKPIAQVSPDTIELPIQLEANGRFSVRLGDLMLDTERVVLANLYMGKLPVGKQAITNLQIKYSDPAQNYTGLYSENMPVYMEVQEVYKPRLNSNVQKSILILAKYRQTQLAEAKLQKGDHAGAVTMLHTAAKTALQMGDNSAATVLQTSATRLQMGEKLSETDRKRTYIVSKTILQDFNHDINKSVN